MADGCATRWPEAACARGGNLIHACQVQMRNWKNYQLAQIGMGIVSYERTHANRVMMQIQSYWQLRQRL